MSHLLSLPIVCILLLEQLVEEEEEEAKKTILTSGECKLAVRDVGQH